MVMYTFSAILSATYKTLSGSWHALDLTSFADLVPVVHKVDSAIHRINHYPLDSTIGLPNTYPLDSDLSGGKRYPTFEQLGPGRK